MKSKICSKCKIEKETDCFNKKYGKPRSECKDCERAREKNRIKIKYPVDTKLIKKRCRICKLDKDICDFFKNPTKKDGLSTFCKECRHHNYLKTKTKAKDKFNDLSGIKRVCSECKIEKDANEFYFDFNTGLRAKCKKCMNDDSRKYNINNFDKARDYRQRYEKENREKIKERKRQYRENNKAKIRERQRKYVLNNKERFSFYTIRRKEYEDFLDSDFNEELIKCVFERFNNKCFNCGSNEKLSIDHHLPLSKGFGISLENAVLLCKSCNSSKNAKLPYDFYTKNQLKILNSYGIIGSNMITDLTKDDLINFEKRVCSFFERKQIKAPVHLDGGNEDQLIRIFHHIKKDDWVCGTWRMHHKCLLKGVPQFKLMREIIRGHSISLNFSQYKIISSAIVGGIFSIATGLAMAEKLKGTNNKVYCFAGEMSFETGKFNECYKYSIGHDLPIVFVLEDNSKSVCSPTYKLWGIERCSYLKDNYPDFVDFYYDKQGKIFYYKYDPIYPHAGTGNRINF